MDPIVSDILARRTEIEAHQRIVSRLEGKLTDAQKKELEKATRPQPADSIKKSG